MPLDFVNKSFTDTTSTAAIQRRFIDMPMVPKKMCLIRQVQVVIFQMDRIRAFYDLTYAMSVDPDHVLASMIDLDSTMFLFGRQQNILHSTVGFQYAKSHETYMYPEGIECPYTRLPFFVQHSNANTATTDWNIRVFFEFKNLTAEQTAIAVLRRGRGVTRRVP